MKDWWNTLGTNTKQGIVIVPIVLIGLIYAYFRYAYNPLEAEVEEFKKKRDEVWTQLKKTQDTAYWIDTVREREKIIEKELEEAETRLPKDKDMPGMVSKLTEMANSHFSNFTLIQPEKLETEGDYNIYPIQMTIESRYHSFLSFLSEIGNLPKIVIATDLDIREREGQETGYPALANLTINLYTFKQ
ncbi:type 4a pilus biogenesis protein PilO [bacterium]|nr:type 4a pilus biogenesis protein PilO [bacterium]MBU1615613.1 type 4a pilus biogenesis protein PilO [bacterium]